MQHLSFLMLNRRAGTWINCLSAGHGRISMGQKTPIACLFRLFIQLARFIGFAKSPAAERLRNAQAAPAARPEV